MYLGSRKIRSAGRTSGSIEITLPVKLQGFLGVSCAIELRDGLRPEIVLQPNLSEAQTCMRTLWDKLAIGMKSIGDIGEFRLSDFSISFYSKSYWKKRPPLSYADAIQALEGFSSEQYINQDGLSRLVAFMTVRAAGVLGLESDFALAFGDSVSFLISGYSSNLGADFERGMAYRLFGEDMVRKVRKGNLLDDALWETMSDRFKKVYDQFFLWQCALEVYEEDRNNWYRALSFEMESPASEVF